MPNQPIPAGRSEAGFSEEHIDCEVLHLMLANPTWPWRIDEVGREVGHEINAVDAVERLIASGLLHRLGEFVFPTRTAQRAYVLQLGTA